MRRLDVDRRSWEDLGALDPLWAVVSHADRRFGGWTQSEFDATGAHEVDAALRFLEDDLGLDVGRGRALDFGCGAGRLTRALAAHFDSVVGVDVSTSMLERARQMSDVGNVEFVHNAEPDLRRLPSGGFDLVLSLITLQHVSDAAAIEAYVSDFVRLLAPGGVAVFQLPAAVPSNRRLRLRQALYDTGRRLGVSRRWMYTRLNLWSMSLTAVPERRVRDVVAAAGGTMLAAVPDRRAGSPDATDVTYCVGPA